MDVWSCVNVSSSISFSFSNYFFVYSDYLFVYSDVISVLRRMHWARIDYHHRLQILFCIILSPFAFCFIMSKCFCVKEMPTKKIGRQKSLRSRISFRRAFFWILLTSFSLLLFCNNILLSIWYSMNFTCFCIRCPLLYCCFTSFFLDEGLTNKFWGSFVLL